MMRAVHIEDEPRNVELLNSLIKKHCADMVTLVGNAGNIRDAIQLIKNSKPQLVYLDIELKQGNAFELLDQLNDYKFEVIFITAFNEYAIKAFRMNAIDYLLKPISIVELKEATSKAFTRIKHSIQGNENVANALKMIRSEFTTLRISIPVTDGVLFINHEDIIRIEAKGSYSIIYLGNKKTITCTKNMKFLDQILPETSFLRVYHSWIINLKYLKKYFRGKNGNMEMEDGSTVPVSIRKKGKFLNYLPE